MPVRAGRGVEAGVRGVLDADVQVQVRGEDRMKDVIEGMRKFVEQGIDREIEVYNGEYVRAQVVVWLNMLKADE